PRFRLARATRARRCFRVSFVARSSGLRRKRRRRRDLRAARGGRLAAPIRPDGLPLLALDAHDLELRWVVLLDELERNVTRLEEARATVERWVLAGRDLAQLVHRLVGERPACGGGPALRRAGRR